MNQNLIDKGSYYEIEDYEPIIETDKDGVEYVIYCPYIPKFLFENDMNTGRDNEDPC